jgi:hypothetical protein
MKAVQGQIVCEKSLQIIKSRREVLAQSVGSKSVSLQNIAMNSAEVGVDSFGKINIQPIGRLKSLHTPQKNLLRYFIGILFAHSA